MQPSNAIGSNHFNNQVNYTDIKGIKVPIEYVDPVSLEIMENPILVHPSGNTFDQSTIDQIFKNEICAKDPLTRSYILSTTQNRALKDNIERFLSQNTSLRKAKICESSDTKIPCEVIADKVTSFTANQFMGLFIDKNEIIFPANQEIRIYDVNQKLCFKYYQDFNGVNFTEILNNVFLPIAKSVKGVVSEGELKRFVNITLDNNETYISLKATAEIKIWLQQEKIITKISSLLDRLNRANVECFIIRPNQYLILKLSKKNKEYFLEKDHLDRMTALFLLNLPKGYSLIELKTGSVTIIPTVIDIENAVALMGEQGLSIRLIRKKE